MEKKQEIKLEIQMNDDVAVGKYINMAVVNHNDNEFVIDCIYIQPQAPKATVQSRLITSPRHAKRLMLMLQNNIYKYEQQHGTIDLAEINANSPVDRPIH
ncbi:Protein of unknown function [Desulfuromusa kysingii]|uniref:DUF3467 domain-containing protein n=1 Tax=Desulfuromusa kysingii TaxID=37625 RepID=A0A1H3YNC6_9BACT|nr:DUF3467 domain-containing protein [Desulfuromusa kysingii]SEA13109.1 Protein of unknown function [Desulfuromusa kysingii]